MKVSVRNSLLLLGTAVVAARAAPNPLSNGTYDGEEIIDNMPTVDLPLQSTYATGKYKYAIFLSNDGMHQFDYDNYIEEFPESELAKLGGSGIVYTSAKASNPSDSYPGTAALVAGCSPRTHGLYWDVSYARDLYPPGSACQGPIGTTVDLSEDLDIDNTVLDGGGGFNISSLPSTADSMGYMCAWQNGLATAYADKHLTYSFVNGPSGLGLVEGYFPEVSSVDPTDTAQNAWDDLHWSALANWMSGKFVNGTHTPFGPFNLVGANFQALTNAQSTTSYLSSNSTASTAYATPSSNITAVLRHFDDKLSEFIATLRTNGMWNETLLVIGSKQGQTPTKKSVLNFVDPQVLIDAAGVKVNSLTSADWALLFLNDSTQAYTAKANLLASNISATRVNDVFAGDEVWQYGWADPSTDARAPDVVVKPVYGTLYESPGSLEDHGGWYADDSDVNLMVVSGCHLQFAGQQFTETVLNQQIAVTMLQALGLPLAQLDGYRIEGTPVLPCVF